MMQFGHTYDLVMSGVKTQTRRVWQPGDLFRVDFDDTVSITRYSQQSKKRYPVYVIGKTYAVQPGRGRKAGGRILLTGIRSERVQDITNEDALAEGMGWVGESSPRDNYAELWDIVHTRKSERWDMNPLVWVLVFRLVNQPNH